LSRPWNSHIADAIILLVGSVLAVALALLARDAVIFDGSYLPYGNDAFYHARRILDALSGNGLVQFDESMHAPEGSWVNWPWAYDWLLAKLAQLATMANAGSDPMAFLVYVPVIWIPVNIFLLLGICNALHIRPEFKALGVISFALLPLIQRLHGIGAIDHHFIELTFVLLTTMLLLRWMNDSSGRVAAVLCGLALALAQGFHHGLFILQLPILATLLILWLRDSLPPQNSLRIMAAALLGMTTLVALPSAPLWDGQFSMATLSAFHIYIAFCSATLIVFMSVMVCSPRNLLLLFGLAVLLGVPGLSEILYGTKFLSGQLEMLDQIVEMSSPLSMIRAGWGLDATVGLYSWLLLFVPLLLLAGAYIAVTAKDRLAIAYGVLSVFGLGLMLMQLRLSYFGICFMIISPLYFAGRLVPVDNSKRILVLLAMVAIFAVAFRPPLSGTLFRPHSLAGDHLYEMTQPLYVELAKACAAEPGIVAAAAQFGHYIRFHTNCSVIANNFLLTQQHFDKVNEANALFFKSVDQLQKDAPEVRYVLAFLANTFEQREGKVFMRDMADIRDTNPPLIREMMLDDQPPKKFDVIAEVYVDPGADTKTPLAGIYRIEKPDSR